ncbi:MAG: hypothetical protein ACXVGN_00065 [Mycobacteriaceae bacterium]
MGDNSWWFNRAGTVSPLSNPGARVPNYGLTLDLATAPYDHPDQFDALASAMQTYQVRGTASVGNSFAGASTSGSAPVSSPTLWDRATGVAGTVGGALTGAAGEVSNTTRWLYSFGHEDVNWGWHATKDKTKKDTATLAKDAVQAPVAKQIFWGLDKVNEYASTAFVAATLGDARGKALWNSGVWGDAHALTEKRHLNAGEAFVQMFYDDELIQDDKRFEQMRQHNTVFNVGAMIFNVVGAYKADPNVFLGKALGAARDLKVGKLATNGRTAQVQRDILSMPDMASAKDAATHYTNLADKLRATHALSLYDRSQQLRLTAQEVSAGNVSFEDFLNNPAFSTSASGPTLAKLFVDVAHNDADWNLMFRTALGDPTAVGELIGRQGEIADKINAIELKSLPTLESDFKRVEERYQKRLAEQGRPQDAAIEITKYGDWWLDNDYKALTAERDALNARLAAYQGHESWLQRALPGVEDPANPNLPGMRNAPNAAFDSLDRLGGQGFIQRSLSATGGGVKMWQHDSYSPSSWVFRAPTKPFLKRVGTASLNDVAQGTETLTHYLDQRDHILGEHQDSRDLFLSTFAGATNEIEREAVLRHAERMAISGLGAKHGLTPEIMDKLARHLQEQKKQTWGGFSNNPMYSPIRGADGRRLEWVENGSKVSVKVPIDVTQLPNWYPLTNLTDLDRTIRLNADVLRSFDTELRTMREAGQAWTERHIRDFADTLGTTFNHFWKPLALLSIRWPMRVVADESMRVMLAAGAMTHLAHLGEGVKNALYNTGVVRPYEWWNGRRVPTGSIGEESLRAPGQGYDAYDYRAITNPTASVPDSEVDLGKLDPKRYDRLNAKVAERGKYLRALEAHRANVRAAKGVSPEMGDAVAAFTAPERPAWAQSWDNRLAEAEKSTERGFFFDPMNPHQGINKGFAVSPYPARLRTFPRKPSAREMNYWVEKNSDLLSVPTNRAAVWLDRDTGRWHLDVVKTARRREDAMLIASRAQATEFYDIEQGFTRYMSEDFYNHFESPFVKPAETNAPAGVGADQAPVANAADAIGAEIGKSSTGWRPQRKKVGMGTQVWRTRDGKKVVGEGAFGADSENPNIYYGTTSSKGAVENLFSGHSRSLGKERSSRGVMDYKSYDPDSGDGSVADWAKAWSHFVNNHIRYSPIWQRMMDGQSDDQIFEWLMGTAEGRSARKRIGVRGENPDRWVAHEREIFDHMFPNEQSLEAARLGQVAPDRVPDLIPEGMRPTVHGDSIKMGLGVHSHQKLAGRMLEKAMHVLGTMPTDAFVRHPFAATVYKREMRNYLSTVPAEQVTNEVLAAAEAHARAEAQRQVRKILYNIADEREGVHMLRFLSPFFQAQVEVMEKYGHLIMDKPETLARIFQLLNGSQTVHTGLWQVVDQSGKPAQGYSNNNQVIFQVTPTLRGLVDHIPGLKGSLDHAGDLTVPVASLNLILQGDMPYLPSMGPLVTYTSSELVFKDRPELDGTAVYKWMFPFGTPTGDNFIERGMNSVLPAYARRGLVWGTEDMNDAAFARRVSEIGAQQIYEWEKNGKAGPRPTERQALEAAKNEYRLRAASSMFLPAPITPRSPFQHWIDMYRQYKARYGLEADTKFYDAVGPTYFAFAQQATESTGGMSPDVGSKKAYDKYSKLIEQAPDMAGILTGPFATGQFSDAVYQWQLSHRVSPASSHMIRERLSPAERIAQSEVDRGWVEYGKLASVLDAELRNRVAQGGSAYLTANSNADLKAYKDQQILELFKRNPAWQDQYVSGRTSHMGTFLKDAYSTMFDRSLDNRPDIQAFRAYLIGRAKLQDVLIQRQLSGQSSSRQFSFDPQGLPIGDNADLYAGWSSWINETKAKNPMFAEIYNRYLESDDLSIYIDPEVSSVAGN